MTPWLRRTEVGQFDEAVKWIKKALASSADYLPGTGAPPSDDLATAWPSDFVDGTTRPVFADAEARAWLS